MGRDPKARRSLRFSTDASLAATTGSSSHGWRWYLPRAAIVLFVFALVGLLWVLYQQELDEKRSAVTRDILWVEQNVRGSIARDLDQLGRLGADWEELGPRQVEARAAALIQNSVGLVRIAILDESGRALASVPEPARRGGWPGAPSAAARELALSSGT